MFIFDRVGDWIVVWSCICLNKFVNKVVIEMG